MTRRCAISRLRLLVGDPDSRAPGEDRRWSDVAQTVRRQWMAAKFVDDGDLRRDLLDRIVLPYLGGRQPVRGACRPVRGACRPASPGGSHGGGQDRPAVSRRRLIVGDER